MTVRRTNILAAAAAVAAGMCEGANKRRASSKRSHVPNWIGQIGVCVCMCLCIWKWIFRARFISPKRPFSDWPFEFTHHIQTSLGWSERLSNRLSLKYLHFRKNEHYSTIRRGYARCVFADDRWRAEEAEVRRQKRSLIAYTQHYLLCHLNYWYTTEKRLDSAANTTHALYITHIYLLKVRQSVMQI